MQELKEEFRKIYETSENPTEGMLSISEWLAKSSSVFTKSCQTIRNWFGEIISYFERRTTNGVVEGINNKLKLIKRRGYGLRNFRNFWVRSMLSWHLVCWFSIKSNEEPIFVKSELELVNNSVKVNQREPSSFINGDLPSISFVEGLIKTRRRQLK